MFSTAGLARISARRPLTVVIAWVLLLIASIGIATTSLGEAFSTGSNFIGDPESKRGAELIKERLYGGQDQPLSEIVIVRSETSTVDDPAFQAVVERTAAELRAMPEIVAGVFTYYDSVAAGTPDDNGLVSADRRSTLLAVTLAGDLDQATEHVAEYAAAVERQQVEGFQVLTVGDITVDEEFNHLAEEDLLKGEGLGLLAALVVLVVVFGALIVAGVPIVLAFVAIIVAVGMTAILGRVMDLSFFIVNMITMIGLAVGIDYALFIVSRYREERRRGHDKLAAIEIAGGTASKAVFFSGATVVLALLGMFLIPTVVFRSLGAGAILVVIAAVAATLTLVPAILSLLGDRIDWPRRTRYDAETAAKQAAYDRETIHAGFWGRMTRLVMARPVFSVVIASGLLIASALPYIDLDSGQSGVETLPEGKIRTAYELLDRDFPAGRLAPVQVVVDGERSARIENGIDGLIASLASETAFGPVESIEWNEANDLALIRIPLTVEGSSPLAVDAVETLRDELIPAAFAGMTGDVLVTGAPAENADFEAVVQTYTPIVFAFVLGLSFLLLMLAFRSLVVPLKAIVMNLLSVGAAYGLLVLVFQKGYLHGLFGFTQTPMIESWIPIFLFCVLFGLSMDYHVFLLSRIREHYDQTKNNSESVAVGLQSTAKIITGAALIMVAVFAGFASGQLVMFQQVGFGLAVAVILDATIVRSVLVPASMALLGDRNWYLPRWLSWLPDLRIEGAPAAAHGAAMAASPAD
ncbi:MAG: MMPL family transporter [Thermomicrobiales bacterium]|nr:MMPL family transporter [Thermomicrobiales bacterium]